MIVFYYIIDFFAEFCKKSIDKIEYLWFNRSEEEVRVNMKIQENLKRGMTELLILHLLKQEDMYGYQLTQEFEKRSDGLFILKEGTMYPSLYRLIEKGMISDHKELIGKRRTRVYYHIEDAGKDYFDKIYEEYVSITEGIRKILNYKED